MLAALSFVLTDRHDLLNVHLLSPVLTWGVVFGGLYGCGRLIRDVVAALWRAAPRD